MIHPTSGRHRTPKSSPRRCIDWSAISFKKPSRHDCIDWRCSAQLVEDDPPCRTCHHRHVTSRSDQGADEGDDEGPARASGPTAISAAHRWDSGASGVAGSATRRGFCRSDTSADVPFWGLTQPHELSFGVLILGWIFSAHSKQIMRIYLDPTLQVTN